MTDTPIIKLWPEGGPDLEEIEAVLAKEGARKRLVEALRTYGVPALVITPEYNDVRAEETGSPLVFLFPMEKRIVGGQVYDLVEVIEDVVRQKGAIEFFSREDVADFGIQCGVYFRSPQDNPLQQVFTELDAHEAL